MVRIHIIKHAVTYHRANGFCSDKRNGLPRLHSSPNDVVTTWSPDKKTVEVVDNPTDSNYVKSKEKWIEVAPRSWLYSWTVGDRMTTTVVTHSV